MVLVYLRAERIRRERQQAEWVADKVTGEINTEIAIANEAQRMREQQAISRVDNSDLSLTEKLDRLRHRYKPT